MDKYPIKISISSTIDNHSDSLELKSHGTMTYGKDTFFLEYEDSSFIGSEFQLNRIGVSQNLVTINRFGRIDSTMVFEKGKSFNSTVKTPHGEIPLSVFSHVVDSYFDEDTLFVKLKYTMDVGGSETFNNLTLKATVLH